MGLIVDQVGNALAGQGEAWFEGLAVPLAAARWRDIGRTTSIGRETYGTMRYLSGDARVATDEVVRLGLPEVFGAPGPVVVEALRGEVLERYAGLGLDLRASGTIDPGNCEANLRGAFARIAAVPAAAAAIGALLSTVHVVQPEGPDYDVSYSDPILPFSIFLGIHEACPSHGDLRLAEGILHECMHLQLTLIEAVVPLVAGADQRLHSPWQGMARPVQGILHGLYVFRVIRDFHRALIAAGALSASDAAYVRKRIDLIAEEVRSVGDLAGSHDLTDAGRRLATRLLSCDAGGDGSPPSRSIEQLGCHGADEVSPAKGRPG